MNILIPMAGKGTRFSVAGYTFPKPLIEIYGKPMIQIVVENLSLKGQHIFIVQKSHSDVYNLEAVLNAISPGCKIMITRGITEGAACTTLLAKGLINDEPLVIANSDQWIKWNPYDFHEAMAGVDGGILTFRSNHPRWSYARTDGEYVIEVAEKKPISNIATVGVYYWRRGTDYVKYAEQMISKEYRVNGEFYVCPVFNEAIADGLKIRTFDVGEMWGLGTPEDLQTFLRR